MPRRVCASASEHSAPLSPLLADAPEGFERALVVVGRQDNHVAGVHQRRALVGIDVHQTECVTELVRDHDRQRGRVRQIFVDVDDAGGVIVLPVKQRSG